MAEKRKEQIKSKNNYNKLISKLIEKQAYSMGNKVSIIGIAFYICPLINSMTRMGTVEENKINIYVGCGITKESNPEKEFIETENKSMTMRNILVSKKVVD